MSRDTSTGFSVSAAKALFEAAKKPEIRNAAFAAAKNPLVRQAAKNVAQDEKARGAVLNAVKDPSAGNKFSAAFAVADVNRRATSTNDAPPPPPPPHRGTAVAASARTAAATPGKLSGSHSAIRSQLENLHLGGSGGSSSTSASVSPKYQNNTTSSIPPPLPSHAHSSTSSYSHATSSTSSSSSMYNKPVTDPHGIAQYSYTALQSDELSFNVGDTIVLRKKVDDQWFYGENSRTFQSGIVPSSYIQIVIPLAAPVQNSIPGAIYATALYDYNSGQPGDLVFSANQSFVVTSKINDEWLEGEANGMTGIFPANFVSCDQLYRVPLKLSTPSYTSSNNLGTVKANYDYFSGVASDLQFKEGDTLTIVEDIDAQWIMGELNGQRGLVPKTFLGPPYGSPKKSPSKGIAEISEAFSPKKALAIADYHSTDPKHLYVTRGDNLLIVEDVDEYYYRGKLEAFKTLPAGILPKNVVKMSN